MPTTISILGNNAITIPTFGRDNLLTKVQDLAQGHTHTQSIYIKMWRPQNFYP